MFTVLYRWRVKPELEQQFVESWSEITEYYLNNFEGARGSRLHRGSDGFWYAYAQWKSDEHRQKAFQNRPETEAREKLIESIEENFPEIRLEIIADFLQQGK
jgi:heme-degrading monooxygenase HmoA